MPSRRQQAAAQRPKVPPAPSDARLLNRKRTRKKPARNRSTLGDLSPPARPAVRRRKGGEHAGSGEDPGLESVMESISLETAPKCTCKYDESMLGREGTQDFPVGPLSGLLRVREYLQGDGKRRTFAQKRLHFFKKEALETGAPKWTIKDPFEGTWQEIGARAWSDWLGEDAGLLGARGDAGLRGNDEELLRKLARLPDEETAARNTQRTDYIWQHHQKPARSATTLASLSVLDEAEVIAESRRLEETRQSNTDKKALWNARYRRQYRKWYLELRCGFNLLFYGVGSKKRQLQDFAKGLVDGPRVIVNGYFPGLRVRDILRQISKDVFRGEVSGGRDAMSHVRNIAAALASGKWPQHVYILVNNVDGAGMRDKTSQLTLSMLAQIPQVHLIGSIDHVHSFCLWDYDMLQRFQWLKHHMATFEPYLCETQFAASSAFAASDSRRAKGIKFVLRSLTPNHRDILILLAEQMLNEGKKEGVDFQTYLSLCQEGMLASSDVAFRSTLTEMLDHKLIEIRRAPDGNDYYVIPYDEEVITKHILEPEEDNALFVDY